MKIAFASCSNVIMQKGHQPVWLEILNKKPDLLLLLGDNVYMGRGAFNADTLEDHYKKQLAEPHFAQLLNQVDYLAVWDNHDFGTNNLFSNNLSVEQKRKSRELFNTYLKDSSLIPSTPEVYCCHTIGDMQVIMLDVRSYQINPLEKGATLLGAEHEKWLLDRMRHNGRFTLICSGMTFSVGQDSWTQYPEWSRRFRAAISVAPNPLFLGGNMHRNAFIQHLELDLPINEVRRMAPLPHTKPSFYEIISSSVGRNNKHGCPLDKYGIIEIGQSRVRVDLWGRKRSNQFHEIINANTWVRE